MEILKMKSKVSTILFIMAGICMLGGCGASDAKEPTQHTSNSQITTQSETSTTEVNTETVAVNTVQPFYSATAMSFIPFSASSTWKLLFLYCHSMYAPFGNATSGLM